MSACYSVECKIKFNVDNVDKILKKMEERYKKDLENHYDFCIKEYDFKEPKTLKDYLELYFAKHQKVFTLEQKHYDNGNIVYSASSGFNASYSWHLVMLDFFENLEEYLLNGSILNIYDDDHSIYRIKDGKVC